MNLPARDVEAILALLSQTCRLASRNEQICTLMQGLAQHIGAKAWVWGVSVQLAADALPTWLLHHYQGFSEEAFAKFIRAQEHPDMQRLTAPFVERLMQTDGQLTLRRQETDPENHYLQSPARPLWEAAGVAPGLLSCRVLNPTTVSGVALYRDPAAPAFDARECLIAHILLTEVPWLHQATTDEVQVPIRTLSPRRLTVCNLLAQGQSRAAIAAHLQIQESTVNGYAKDIFKTFGVHSQAELMARLHATASPADRA